MKKSLILSTCVLTMTALAGCGADSTPAKDGGAPPSITLSAVAYTTNTITGETLAQFTTEVDRATEGAMTLEEGPKVDPGAQDGSADVIGMVRDGTADVGIVASRTFDLEGATSLQALNVPMVVDSPAQAAKFLADPLTEQMLAGLEGAGVVGLALTYDQMRQPLGFSGPLAPEDLDGSRFLARPSKASSVVISALGATSDPRNGDAAEEAVRRRQVVGEETSMDRPSGFQGGAPGHTSAITGNVQLSIKANVIIVNPQTWSGLTDDQQASLRDAASATRDWAGTQTVSLADSSRAFCDQHIGDVVVADADELTRWRSGVEAAVSELKAADPVTGAAVDRMREIAADTPSTDIPTACTMVPPDELPTVEPEGDQDVVAGEWRLLVSSEKFAAAGASAQDVGLNQGAWTFTFEPDGGFKYVEPRGRSCAGRFAVAGDRLSMTEDTTIGDCDGRWEFTFARDGDRMTWTPTPEFEATYPPLTGFVANPLERIAGP